MYKLIDGKEIASKIKAELKVECDKLRENGIIPKLAVILVGDDPASKIYVRNKSKACQEVGIEYEEILLDKSTNMDKLLKTIDELNARKDVNGILLQSPIPNGLNIKEAFNRIDYRKDVDGFNPINVGKHATMQDCFIPCTAYGIMKMFEYYNIDIEGKNAVIIGRSNIVGKPLSLCLLNSNATVTICHSKTKEMAEATKKADILVSAVRKS